MSRVIGFKIVSGSMNWVVVEGTKTAPLHVAHDRVVSPSGYTPAELVDWAETVLSGIVSRVSPDEIAYKLTMPPALKHDTIFRIYYPQGILNLVAHRMGIAISHVASQAVSPSVFGLPKGTNGAGVISHVKDLLGDYPPNWTGEVLDAATAAVVRLP